MGLGWLKAWLVERLVPKWPQNCPKMVPFWHQIRPKIVSKWSQNYPKEVWARPGAQQTKKKTKTTLEAAKGPKVSRNGPNMVPSWSQIGPKTVQKWSPWPPKTLTIAREVLHKSMFEALRQNLW